MTEDIKRLVETPALLKAIEDASAAQWGDTIQNHKRGRRTIAAINAVLAPFTKETDHGEE